jgi:hypothetical protein
MGFRNQKPGRKLEICRRLVGAMSQLPPEKREQIRFGALEEKLEGAEKAVQEIPDLRAQLRAALTRRNKALKEMCRAAERCATAHAVDVNWDPAKLLEGGLELTPLQRPLGAAAAPENLRARHGTVANSVRLSWKRPARRCVFVIEATTDPNGRKGWTQMQHCTAQKCILKNLEAGKLYWFRVAAIVSAGQGPWSQTATIRPQ